MSLLDVQHLTISFAHKKVVEDFSFHIESGECVALIGQSGSGKSVTALSILKLVQDAKITGKIIFKGTDLTSLSEKEIRPFRGGKIGFIFQEPMTSLNPLHRIDKQIGEVLKVHFGQATKSQILDLLKSVHLKNPAQKMRAFPHELSGGERQRVMIAMALAGQPELLIADEPTTALDVTIQKQILDLLKELQHTLHLAILFISHNEKVVRYMAARPYAIGQNLPIKNHPFIQNKSPTQTILSVHNLTVYYHHFKALDNVSFTLQAGKTLAVVGESGSGKTTLAQALVHLIPSKGEIKIESSHVPVIGYVFQDPFSSLNPRFSVMNILEEGLKVHTSATPPERRENILNILQKVDLSPDILNRYPHELSGGQRQRIALARALLLRPKVLILDEVTSALDKQNQAALLSLLVQVQADFHISYILITHDMDVVQQMADDVLVLHNGEVIESAKVSALFANPHTVYTQKLIQSSLLTP